MLLWDIQVESPALGPPMILLWLLCVGVTGQDPCSSPGEFPSPKLSLSSTSAWMGGSVLAECSLLPLIAATLVIFCQDGKQISNQSVIPGQSLYQYHISVQRSAQFRCMYQYRNNQNHVGNSLLSQPRTLHVTGKNVPSSTTEHSSSGSSEKKPTSPNGLLQPDSNRTLSPTMAVPQTDLQPHSQPPDIAASTTVTLDLCSKLEEKDRQRELWGLAAIGGVMGLSILCLVPLICLLKKVTVKRSDPREELPNRSTENTPTEEQIHYAAISEFGAARHPQVRETEVTTYAVIGKACDVSIECSSI
nr:uncharacterized protein LOC112547013 [Pelodiscus sinensis]|eukprot:XP_025044205.1 uncharacterized protein LOC112547013 [Pelodiscus sinensis]